MELWKALAVLYPTARPTLDYEIRDDGAGARIGRWNLTDPQPDDTALLAAIVAYDTAQAQRNADAQTLRQKVVTVAQSAVGLSIDTLTAAQVRALVAVVLWRAGALKPDGTVKPLAEWT